MMSKTCTIGETQPQQYRAKCNIGNVMGSLTESRDQYRQAVFMVFMVFY